MKIEKEIIKYPSMHGISITEKDIPTSFPAHWHNAAEFMVFLKDGASYQIGNTVYRPKAGDILFVWPRELHIISHMPKNGVFFIQFASDIIESNQDLVSASVFLTSLHLLSSAKNPLLAEEIRNKIYEIRDIYKAQSYFSETRCKRSIYELLTIIGDYVLQERYVASYPERFSDASLEYIRSACSYIAAHSSEDISQSQVANLIGLSSSYFSKLFKKYTQRSFPMYLSEIRVQNAIHLLANEQLTITECAFQAGFQSTTAFNKVFHETTGYSPRDYRKLHNHNYNYTVSNT